MLFYFTKQILFQAKQKKAEAKLNFVPFTFEKSLNNKIHSLTAMNLLLDLKNVTCNPLPDNLLLSIQSVFYGFIFIVIMTRASSPYIIFVLSNLIVSVGVIVFFLSSKLVSSSSSSKSSSSPSSS